MHLEGALSPAVLFSLARRNNIQLPQDDAAYASVDALNERYSRFTSLDDFLHYYYIGMSVLITESDFYDLAVDYFTRASSQGVMHAEVFFDPQAHLSRGVSYTTILSGFSRARTHAEKTLNLTSELICCFLRHLPPADCLSTFQHPDIQASYKDGSVIGIGLDSSEADFPPHLFNTIYEQAGALGLKRTAHAAEEGPASFARSALDDLHVSRIDHGMRIVEDAELMARVAREEILLTLCPLSNKCLGGVKEISELPVREFLDNGVRFSVNSDDPAYFGGYILENYCAVQAAFELSVAEWEVVVRNGIEGSWCSGERKEVIRRMLDDVVRQHA
ncbi:hypothetical protein MBLNU457_g0190t2 [Dothideomycetes sp. NU457]